MFINQLFLDKNMIRGDRLKVLLLIFLLLNNIVFAQLDSDTSDVTTASAGFDQAKSYDWLYEKMVNATFTSDIRSLGTLALIQGTNKDISGLIDEIKKLEDSTLGCWPKEGCKVKDSALATLALALSGQDVSKEVQWLKSARIPGLTGNDWLVVIKSGSDGTCDLTYPGATAAKTFNIVADKVKTPTGTFTADQYYIKLSDLNPGLVGAGAQLQPKITVSCPNLQNPIVTLVYKPNVNTFFIQKSDPAANLELVLANACFKASANSNTCDYESTAYATWALVEIGFMNSNPELTLDKIGTHIYLEAKALDKKSDPKVLGLLNRILVKSGSAAVSFINDLVNIQRVNDGSWGNGDVLATAVASFGLTGTDKADGVSKGLGFLTSRVLSDGSWPGGVEATAWSLVALHGGELTRISVPVSSTTGGANEICGNNIDDDGDGVFDCGEAECAVTELCHCQNSVKDGDETGIDCGGLDCSACTEAASCSSDIDCSFGEECVLGECVQKTEITSTPECETDDECDEGEECVDNKCVAEEETPPAEESSLWWLWLIIILLILGGGFFFYVKFIKTGKISFKKKSKGQTFEDYRRSAETRPPQRPITRPVAPVRPSPGAKAKEDDELEKSLKEAQKLLKG